MVHKFFIFLFILILLFLCLVLYKIRWFKNHFTTSDYIDLATLVLAAIAIVFSYEAHISSDETLREQQKTQSYTYWQDFLASTVKYPELANGLDTFDEYSIHQISHMSMLNRRNLADSTYRKYLKYTWFVANVLNAAEIVNNLQKHDLAWQSTLINVLKGHTAFYECEYLFQMEDYEPEFQILIIRAFAENSSSTICTNLKLIAINAAFNPLKKKSHSPLLKTIGPKRIKPSGFNHMF